MAELVFKNNVRCGYRGVVTRKVREVDAVLAADPNPDKVRLAQLKFTLKEKLETLAKIDLEILILGDENAIEGDITQSEKVRDTIYEALAKIEAACEPAAPVVAANPLPRPLTPPAPLRHAVPTKQLPELKLLHFNGDMTKWTPFWDSYKAAIHEDSELSDIDKFTYLRSLLEHTASEAISGLTLTAANYAEAVDILRKRFGDNDRIIESHMEALAGLKAVSSSHKLQALKKLFDQVGAHIRGL